MIERKELKDYKIGEAMEICNAADSSCWMHIKDSEYPNIDCMERCPFYETSRTGGECKLKSDSEPVNWNVQRKPIGEYTINEWIRRCYENKADCNRDCMFGPVCKETRIKAPAYWEV